MGRCRHFLEGKCTYGDKCKFEHIDAATGSKEWKDEVKLEKKRTRKRVESFIADVRSRIKARLTFEDRSSLAVAQELAEIALAGAELPEGGQPKVPLPGTKTRLCSDFIFGSCVLGVTCLLAHDPDELVLPKEEVSKPIDEDKPPLRKIVEEDNLGKWVEVDAETLDKMANSKEAYRYKTSLCRLFDVGACPKGELCVFAHGDNELQLPGQTAKTMRRLQAAPESWITRVEKQSEHEKRVLNRVRREPTRASLCKHFDLGQCRHGKSCKFAHGEEELDVAKKNETEGAQKAEHENATKAAAAAMQAAVEEETARVEAAAQSTQAALLDTFAMLREVSQVSSTEQGGLVVPTLAALTGLPGMLGLPTAAGLSLPAHLSVPGQLPNVSTSVDLARSNLRNTLTGIPGISSTLQPQFVPPPPVPTQSAMFVQQLPMQLLPAPLQQIQFAPTMPSFTTTLPIVGGMPGFM